jgi:hypothetical protein
LLSIGLANAQTTFNHRVRFGHPSCVITSVIATDSCYYMSAVMSDTVPPFKSIIGFVKYSLSGDSLGFFFLQKENQQIEAWTSYMQTVSDTSFILPAIGLTNIGDVFSKIIRFNSAKQIEMETNFYSPNYPTISFMKPAGLLAKSMNTDYFLINQFGAPNAVTNMSLIRTDSEGSLKWQKNFGTNNRDRPESISWTPDSNILVGASYSNQNLGLEPSTTPSILRYQTALYLFDTLGVQQWSWFSPVSMGFRDAANDVLPLPDGSIIVASAKGKANCGTTGTHCTVGSYVRNIFKLSPMRQVEWDSVLGDHNKIFGSASKLLLLNGDTTFLVFSWEANLFAQTPQILKDKSYGVIEKYHINGHRYWARRYVYEPADSLNGHEVYDAKISADGGIIVVGESHSLADYPQQGWILKLDSMGCLVPGCHLNDPTNSSNELGTTVDVLVYPNPTSDLLNFTISSGVAQAQCQVSVFDLLGRIIYQNSHVSSGYTYMVPVDKWPAGQYFLHLTTSNGFQQRVPFVVTR